MKTGEMTMMMTGKKNNSSPSFIDIFEKQQDFQREVLRKRGENKTAQQIPVDDIKWFSYHIQAMVEELGEVLKADKRWKTHRNKRYEKEEKLYEIVDVIITAFNLAMFSGFSAEDMYKALENKINENIEKLKKEETHENNNL